MLVGGIIGLVCGLLPLIAGIVKKKAKLGSIGFIVCILAGIPFSLWGGLLAAIIFTVLIFRRKKDLPDDTADVKI